MAAPRSRPTPLRSRLLGRRARVRRARDHAPRARCAPAATRRRGRDWVIVAGALALLPLAAAAVRNIGAVRAARGARGEPPARPERPHVRLPLAAGRARRRADADRPIVNLVAARRRWRSRGARVRRAGATGTGAPTLGWHPIDDARARGGARLRRAALQPLRRGRLPDLVRAREAGVRRRPPGSVSAVAPAARSSTSSAGSAPYRPLFERWGIRCAFLPVTSPTVAALDRDGWITRYRDDSYTVLSAPPAGTATSRP